MDTLVLSGNPGEHSLQNPYPDSYGLRVLVALRRIMRAVDISSRKLNVTHKMTVPQRLCLHALAQEEPLMLTVLAQRVNLGVSTVNGIVDRMEAKGWVTRRRSDIDNRRVYVALAELGREAIRNTPSLLQDRFYEALGKLPESEQAAIAASLEQVVRLMEAEHLAALADLFPGDRPAVEHVEDTT